MRDSKKAFLSTGIFFLLVAALSAAFLMLTTPYAHNFDWYLREELAGSLDFLIAGASHGQCALYAPEIDRTTGSSCYNLCYDSQKSVDKHWLLSKELARNDVGTVVLELSHDTFQLSDQTDYTDANIFSVMRMDSLSDRLPYFLKYVNLDNKLYVYSEMMYSGLFGYLRPGSPLTAEETELKGSRLVSPQDHTLPEDEAAAARNQDRYSTAVYREKTIEGFTDVIRLCKEYDVRVIVAVMPVHDNFIWRTDNLDDFSEWNKAYCAENQVEYYDFNLIKERYGSHLRRDLGGDAHLQP